MAAAAVAPPVDGGGGVDTNLLAPECVESARNFVCAVCLDVPLPENARVCHYCEAAVFCQTCAASLSECAVCREKFEANLPRPLKRLALNVLSGLRVRCPQRCDDAACLALGSLSVHMKTACPQRLRACGFPDCTTVVPACEFDAHKRECEFQLMRCEMGCGLLVARRVVAAHDCVSALIRSLDEAKETLSYLSHDLDAAVTTLCGFHTNHRINETIPSCAAAIFANNLRSEFERGDTGTANLKRFVKLGGWKFRVDIYLNGMDAASRDFVGLYVLIAGKDSDERSPFKGHLTITLGDPANGAKSVTKRFVWKEASSWGKYCLANAELPSKSAHGISKFGARANLFAPRSRKRKEPGSAAAAAECTDSLYVLISSTPLP